MTRVFSVRPDQVHFRHLVSRLGWRFDNEFLWGRRVSVAQPIQLESLSLIDDVAEQRELIATGEVGDVELARTRHSRGFGDLVYVEWLTSPLVFSGEACRALREVFESAGQILEACADGMVFHVWNCTRVIDAVNEHESSVRFAGGLPSQFTRLVLDSRLEAESLFRVSWPKSILPPGVAVPPPIQVFATEKLVDEIRSLGLQGFQFREIETTSAA